MLICSPWCLACGLSRVMLICAGWRPWLDSARAPPNMFRGCQSWLASRELRRSGDPVRQPPREKGCMVVASTRRAPCHHRVLSSLALDPTETRRIWVPASSGILLMREPDSEEATDCNAKPPIKVVLKRRPGRHGNSQHLRFVVACC